MKIRTSEYQPTIMLLAVSLSSIGASFESGQILQAVNDIDILGIARYTESCNVSVLDADTESASKNDYIPPKAKRSYKMKVRVIGRAKGVLTNYEDHEDHLFI